MALTPAKQIIQELHDTVLTTGNFDLFDRYYVKNVIFHSPYLSYSLKGRDQLREFMVSVFFSFRNLKIRTEEVIADGNRVSVRWTIEGYSVNEFMNVPAGGDQRVICVITHYHVRNGKVCEIWSVDSSMWPKVFDF